MPYLSGLELYFKRYLGGLLIVMWVSVPVQADPFLRYVEQANPQQRVRLVLFYFDTCRAATKHQAVAFRMLDAIDAIGQRQHDGLLQRYGRMLRDTYAKNNLTLSNRQKAELFLSVAEQADADKDAQITGVCEHFAGLYYYLSEDYGRAFQYLLTANDRFRQIGYANIPEIQRYLCELAFDYYYIHEDDKVIALLTEAGRYAPFSSNLHIQTYNTLAMAHARRSQDAPTAAHLNLAEQNYRKAYQLAVTYRDSAWMGITYGNLGRLYAKQQHWKEALDAYRVDYRLVMRSGRALAYLTAVSMADAFYELKQLDSCRHYLNEGKQMHRLSMLPNTAFTDYSLRFQDELFWQRYYDVARRYYHTTGNLPLSARCTDSLLVYQTRIDKRYRSKAAALAEQRLLIQQQQSEMTTLQEQSLRQWLLLGLGAGVALLVAGWLGLLYRSSQRRRQREAFANAERQKHLERENQQLATERDHAKAALALFLDNLRQTEYEHTLTEASLLTPDDWDKFRHHFEHVYPHFFAQLHTQFTDLTPAEERLLALSKLKIDTRRMGQMLGISPSSVRTTKYRLRKRLGIDGQSALGELLA